MGFADVQNLLVSGQTYCLVGSSGVGKTTLLNNLIGEPLFEISKYRLYARRTAEGGTQHHTVN